MGTAFQRGIDEEYDVVICDTAGRLQNKKQLMSELEKIVRVTSWASRSALGLVPP